MLTNFKLCGNVLLTSLSPAFVWAPIQGRVGVHRAKTPKKLALNKTWEQ